MALLEHESNLDEDDSMSNTLFENDRGQGQDGLVLQPDGLFNDKRKADKLPFICQGNRGNQRKL